MIHIRTSKEQWLFSLFALLCTVFAQTQEEVSIFFVGDVMQHDGQIKAAYHLDENRYDYADGFRFVRPLVQAHDFAVANLEVTLGGPPFKGYPQFSAPDELAETLKYAGFDVILTANNHACDRGAKGVIRTIEKLDELGLTHTGTFRSKEEREQKYPLIIEKQGIKVAMLNYTYSTNGIFVDPPLIVNYIDKALIKSDVAEARRRGLILSSVICTGVRNTYSYLMTTSVRMRSIVTSWASMW